MLSVKRRGIGLGTAALLASCGGRVTVDSMPADMDEAGGNSATDTGAAGSGCSGAVPGETAGMAGNCADAGAGPAGAAGSADPSSDECAACATRCVDGHCLVVAEIAAGAASTCARTADGTAWCWGYNARGEVGDGSTEDRFNPTHVQGLTGVSAIAVGASHSCALEPERTLRCWGHNYYGQLGDGTTENRLVPVEVPGLSEVAQVAAGTLYTCAALLDGTVRCWGSNDRGQLGDDTSISLRSPFAVPGITDAASVAAGGHHTCALIRDQTLRCWGSGRFGALGNATIPECEVGGSYPNYFPGCDYLPPGPVVGLGNVVQIELHALRSCARTTQGSLWCWGVLLGPEVSMTATPQQVDGFRRVEQVGMGLDHTCVRLDDATVHCWGTNEHGQLGIGADVDAVWTPTEVPGLTDVVELAIGDNHNCALLRSGHVLCWGANHAGQLGDGSQLDRDTPTPVLWH